MMVVMDTAHEVSAYDVDALRSHFPSLTSGLAHFDGPGGTQTPRPVGEAIAATITGPLSNRGTSNPAQRNAEEAVQAFRSAYSDLLGVPPEGVVHGRSATALIYDFARAIAKTWQPGDEVVVSRLDHDANVRPWVQAARAAGATVRWIDIDPESAELDLDSAARVIGPHTVLVAFTAASNLLGTKVPARAVADLAHAVGALVFVDGVHYAAHATVDRAALGADLFVCSPYKFLGPHCGVLAADPALLAMIDNDKLLPSSESVPERFELGTLPYEVLAGATAAVDFLAGIAPGDALTRRERLVNSLRATDAHEAALRERLEAGLRALGPDLVIHSRARERTPTLCVSFPGRDAGAADQYLTARGVLAPADRNFYAYEPAVRMGLPEKVMRFGMAPYSTVSEVDRAIEGLAEFVGRG